MRNLKTLRSDISFREKDKKSDQKKLNGNINRSFLKKWRRGIGKAQYLFLNKCRFMKFKKIGNESVDGQGLKIQ